MSNTIQTKHSYITYPLPTKSYSHIHLLKLSIIQVLVVSSNLFLCNLELLFQCRCHGRIYVTQHGGSCPHIKSVIKFKYTRRTMCCAALLVKTFFLPPLHQRSNPSATLNTRAIFIFPLLFWFLFLDHVFHYFSHVLFSLFLRWFHSKTFVFIYFEFKCVQKNKNIYVYILFFLNSSTFFISFC